MIGPPALSETEGRHLARSVAREKNADLSGGGLRTDGDRIWGKGRDVFQECSMVGTASKASLMRHHSVYSFMMLIGC